MGHVYILWPWNENNYKIIKNTNVGIAFKTNNTIKSLKTKKPDNIYQKRGVYQLKCNECPLKYIGQTERTFKYRYREHIQAIRTNRHTSKYAQHILDTGHSYGTMEETMDIIKTTNKEHLHNTLERFYIYYLSKNKLQMNDTYTDTHNPIFDLIINNPY
jgi:hypothetical protein